MLPHVIDRTLGDTSSPTHAAACECECECSVGRLLDWRRRGVGRLLDESDWLSQTDSGRS